MRKTAKLEAALERRFFSLVTSLGFVRDNHQKPRLTTFRRKTNTVVQVFGLVWHRSDRPRFRVQFCEAPLAGIDHRGKHISADDLLPGNISTLHGSVGPGFIGYWFRTDQLLRRRSAEQVVDELLDVFPEILTWWKNKTAETRLKVFPPKFLPPEHKFSGVPAMKSSTRRWRIRYLMAYSIMLIMGSAGALSAILFIASAASLLTSPFSLIDWFLFAIGVVASAPLGCIAAALLVGPIVTPIVAKINGAPFHKGDLVRVLVGPRRDYVARVYEVWDTRGQVRVELDEQSMETVKDVFSYIHVCREKVAKPANETNVD